MQYTVQQYNTVQCNCTIILYNIVQYCTIEYIVAATLEIQWWSEAFQGGAGYQWWTAASRQVNTMSDTKNRIFIKGATSTCEISDFQRRSHPVLQGYVGM